MNLKTDTLYLDRLNSKAYYNTLGVILDEKSKLTSNRGIYFMDQKKYRFISNVKIENPEYDLKSQQLDYFTELNKAYFYGPTTIIGEDYDILFNMDMNGGGKHNQFTSSLNAIQQHKENILLLQLLFCQ